MLPLLLLLPLLLAPQVVVELCTAFGGQKGEGLSLRPLAKGVCVSDLVDEVARTMLEG
jgi:hypothetical protein